MLGTGSNTISLGICNIFTHLHKFKEKKNCSLIGVLSPLSAVGEEACKWLCPGEILMSSLRLGGLFEYLKGIHFEVQHERRTPERLYIYIQTLNVFVTDENE